MIEHPRKHGPFDPRFRRQPARAAPGEAESSELHAAALSTALQTWEGEGGAAELLERRHATEERAPRAAASLSATPGALVDVRTPSTGLA
jgi:hypothetical protein